MISSCSMRFQEPPRPARRSLRPPTRSEPPFCGNHNILRAQPIQTPPMKSQTIENIVVDEVHARTYVVMADRVLTDGELYKAIRQEILKRGSPLAKGERLVISLAKN